MRRYGQEMREGQPILKGFCDCGLKLESCWVIHRQYDARDEFVSDYSVPGIITQYQGLLLSTRDYYSVPGIITQYQGLSGFLGDF